MFEKEAEKWVKDVFPNDEFKQSGISMALVEFAELGYNKAFVEADKNLKAILTDFNKANERLIKAKEIIGELISSLSVVGECEEEECELLNRAEQFISEVEK